MVCYEELGLVNTRDLFKRAMQGGYAVHAFNFNNLGQLLAIVAASVETRSPVICRSQRAHVNMQIRPCCNIWSKAQER